MNYIQTHPPWLWPKCNGNMGWWAGGTRQEPFVLWHPHRAHGGSFNVVNQSSSRSPCLIGRSQNWVIGGACSATHAWGVDNFGDAEIPEAMRPWRTLELLLEVESFQSVTKVSKEKMNIAPLPLEACRPHRCWSPTHPPVRMCTHTQPSLGHLPSLIYSLGKWPILDFYCPASHKSGERRHWVPFQKLKSF